MSFWSFQSKWGCGSKTPDFIALSEGIWLLMNSPFKLQDEKVVFLRLKNLHNVALMQCFALASDISDRLGGLSWRSARRTFLVKAFSCLMVDLLFWMTYASWNRFVVSLTTAFLVRWLILSPDNVDDFVPSWRCFWLLFLTQLVESLWELYGLSLYHNEDPNVWLHS